MFVEIFSGGCSLLGGEGDRGERGNGLAGFLQVLEV